MIHRLLLGLFVAILSFSVMISTAEAKRFGGGKSFGYQRSASSMNSGSKTLGAQPAARPQSTASKWLGPLAGLAMGGLLASLFMGHGLGAGMLSWILLAGALFLGWRLLSRFMSANRQSSSRAAFQSDQGSPVSHLFKSTLDEPTTSAPVVPQGFDEASFVRQAKTTFIRLQNAYDHKNLTDIREFTTPEVFAEVQMQLQERGNDTNQTEVLFIDAALADLDLQSNVITASVRFTGSIRETQDAPPVSINEIWHFTKDKFSNQWLVAGIQQEGPV